MTSRTFTCDLILTVFYWSLLESHFYQSIVQIAKFNIVEKLKMKHKVLAEFVYRHNLQTNFCRNCIIWQERLLVSAKIRLLVSHIPTLQPFHCVKSVLIQSFLGPYFPPFGPEKLRIRTVFIFTQCFIKRSFCTTFRV